MDEWTERGRKRLIKRFCVAHPNFSVKNLPGARFVRWTCNSLAAITLRVWFVRRTLCWILSRWSLPPDVLVVTVPSSSSKVCARAHHVIILATPNPQGHQRLSLLSLFLVVFARQLCRRLTIPSESIYFRYLYSPPVMTDSRQTVLSSPFHSQHLPPSFQPLYTTLGQTLLGPYIHNYNLITVYQIVQSK